MLQLFHLLLQKIKKDPRKFIFTVIENSDSSGIKSVENFFKKSS
jgi:hypothetical protein